MSTTIEWTATVNADGSITPGETWNPTGGCDQISPGCAHCYAKEQWDRRHKAMLSGKAMAPQYAKPFEDVQLFPGRLQQPFKWRQPRRVFVNSVSDLFHDSIPDEFIERVFAVMALCPQHTFQILTKRAGRMSTLLTRYFGIDNEHFGKRVEWTIKNGMFRDWPEPKWPLPNVWLGVSVENQRFADERIPLLLQTPAAVRFISAEPLLGPVDLEMFVHCQKCRGRGWYSKRPFQVPFPDMTPCEDCLERARRCGSSIKEGQFAKLVSALDWVIVGGESGPGARPFDLAWARSIVQQCRAAGVACFVKQAGDNAGHTGTHNMAAGQWIPLRLLKRKGGDLAELPEELRVREFPEVRACV